MTIWLGVASNNAYQTSGEKEKRTNDSFAYHERSMKGTIDCWLCGKNKKVGDLYYTIDAIYQSGFMISKLKMTRHGSRFAPSQGPWPSYSGPARWEDWVLEEAPDGSPGGVGSLG